MMMVSIDPPTSDVPTYDVRILTKGQLIAQIVLDGHVYTLRITKAGKLILTK
jgi:hemin uptake protein HemP